MIRLSKGQVLYFQCGTTNRYGKLWVYGRVQGTETYGWMSKDNFEIIRNANHWECPTEADRV